MYLNEKLTNPIIQFVIGNALKIQRARRWIICGKVLAAGEDELVGWRLAVSDGHAFETILSRIYLLVLIYYNILIKEKGVRLV